LAIILAYATEEGDHILEEEKGYLDKRLVKKK
jgi:hypothetical protein